MIDPDHVPLTPVIAQALRQAFVRALQTDDTFSDDDRHRLEYFVEATSNVEDLMSLYFVRYSLGREPDQKSFLYIVWMLWAFLRLGSFNPPIREHSIYALLRQMSGDVITFNTHFFDAQTAKRVNFFHGRLTEYLALDSRELVGGDPALQAATTVDGIVKFIQEVRLDVREAPAIDIPSFVPPTKFKPFMNRTQLRTWTRADDLLGNASTTVIIGYSFAIADEHFNDILRHANRDLRVVVINPDLATASREAGRVLNIAAEAFATETKGGFEVRRAGRLVCAAARAEDLSEELLQLLA